MLPNNHIYRILFIFVFVCPLFAVEQLSSLNKNIFQTLGAQNKEALAQTNSNQDKLNSFTDAEKISSTNGVDASKTFVTKLDAFKNTGIKVTSIQKQNIAIKKAKIFIKQKNIALLKKNIEKETILSSSFLLSAKAKLELSSNEIVKGK